MLLLIPGPVQTRPEVRAAAAQDYAPWDNDFRWVFAEIRERVLGIAGGIPGEHAALALQGCGHFIMEAALRSFVAAATGKVLVPLNGTYSGRIERLAREAGRQVVPLKLPETRPVRPEEIAAALAADPGITHVALVYSETGGGVVNDPRVIGPVVRAAGRRLILDAVSAFGALPFNLAEHPECDAVMFTSGKCLEGLPGIAFAVVRVDSVQAAAGNAGSWSFDLSDLYGHALRAGWGNFRFTPPVQALAALRVALDFHAQEGQEARLARYVANARTFYQGMRRIGLKPYLEETVQGPIITIVHQPPDPGFELQRFVDELKAREVLISNFYNTPTPTFRVGCIGAVTPADMERAVAAVDDSLTALQVRQRAA
jgi:2-aminoethylphosphonate-pyruvate transaminase